MNKKKILKYLNSKNINSYSNLDKILKQYIDGDIEKTLSKYNFSKIEIFVDILKKGNFMEIFLYYKNLTISIGITEDLIDYYLSDRQHIIRHNTICFNEDFELNILIYNLYKEVTYCPQLIDASKVSKKTQITKKLSTIFLLIPISIIIIISIYVLFYKKTLDLNPWFLLLIIIPIIFWFVLDVKSKINKR